MVIISPLYTNQSKLLFCKYDVAHLAFMFDHLH
jgi:hypothetical protein